ncbi:MAG: hypothetical protein Q8933_02380 [Bacteroidota bacterium]|nr:hypothetical protein [Bacteroidota bacterium]MDP4190165.1 hypothetical protein [Bacteroidota bacterium]MDP4193764.1 hypothetical protein [Bacteroidota bacterium]
MNKIILHTGLLIFFISVIFFSQKGMALQDIIIRSLVVFVVSTIMLSILVLVVVRSINKTSLSKSKSITETITRE